MTVPPSAFQALRTEIARIEAGRRVPSGVLPFGLEPMDRRLPCGGLTLGALHEVAGGGDGAVNGAAAALFAAGIAARTPGPVLWCVTRPDLFAPALEQAGLSSNRVIYAEAGDEAGLLAAFEDGLRHGGFGAVVGEVARLSMTASRRLQLVAEESGSMGLAVRRWRRQAEAAEFGQPTAAATRWRVTALPSAPLPVAGVGRPRWFVELIRCRAGDCADFELEACDETGRLALPAHLVDRPIETPAWAGLAVA
ncbi:ImuA family protein [Brevundimonas nasdae]|uniref:Damage-inducible protein n=1 Tax=Brevundimonas nasdae TaxID=172043 RepID=A0ABX8TN61_9CAUL|nr:damage-inducible protein [Brevundimonas nasdae]QYC11477.1 damage-inducible protein [Brevundimonas nasdae]QYC14265.1 damage-inducible protein [Brevundimonas nasdae]